MFEFIDLFFTDMTFFVSTVLIVGFIALVILALSE